MAAPGEIISTDLERAEQGIAPTGVLEDLLRAFHLDGPEPDGLTLTARVHLSDEDGNPPFGVTTLTLAGSVLRLARRITRQEEHTPEQELMLITLIRITERQIKREGDICGFASRILLKVAEARPDLVNEDILSQLAPDVIDTDEYGELVDQLYTDFPELGVVVQDGPMGLKAYEIVWSPRTLNPPAS